MHQRRRREREAVRHSCSRRRSIGQIVIKSWTTFADFCLNFAGMLAPVVAIAPTTDVGNCWSVEPSPLSTNEDGSFAGRIVASGKHEDLMDTNRFYRKLALGDGGVVSSY